MEEKFRFIRHLESCGNRAVHITLDESTFHHENKHRVNAYQKQDVRFRNNASHILAIKGCYFACVNIQLKKRISEGIPIGRNRYLYIGNNLLLRECLLPVFRMLPLFLLFILPHDLPS